jgi:hypothetical protein
MYTYFASYKDTGAPSFSKFARSVGLSLEMLLSFMSKSEFNRAYRECNEIRRDYLIDLALSKRADGSFTKFILTEEYGMGRDMTSDSSLDLTLHVIGEGEDEA